MDWTPDIVKQEIINFHSKGEELKASNVRQKYGALYYAGRKHFESWGRAVNEAGLELSKPWSRERVLIQIKKMKDNKEDLSTKVVRNKYKSLHDAGYRLFGSWQNACAELGIDVKSKINWNAEKVLTEIEKFHNSGEMINSRNVQAKNNALLKAAKRYFGSWDEAIAEAGFNPIEIKRKARKVAGQKVSKSAQDRFMSESYIEEQKEKIINELKMLYENGEMNSIKFRENNSALFAMVNKYFESTAEAMKQAGISYEALKKEKAVKKWTKDRILSEIVKIKENGEQLNVGYIIKNHRQLYRASVTYLESWENALTLVGIDYQKIKSEVRERVKEKSTIYTKEFVVNELLKMKENGCTLSQKHIKEYNLALYDACYNRFGSLESAVKEAGINYDKEMENAREQWLERQREVQLKWTKEKIIKEILYLHQKDTPLSKSYIQNNHQSLYDGANNRFGSWRLAVTSAGLNYDNFREDMHKASYCGQLFEFLVNDLLRDLGVKYEKYKHERWNPDYVLPNNIWLDAKLSQWTVHTSKTIENYKEHCRLLIIIYMRGRRGEVSDQLIDRNVRMVSVFKYIKQLPKYMQKKYNDRIKEIEAILSEYEVWDR